MLELRNVSFSVADETGAGDKEILKNVSLTVEKNEFVVITGPNGGGKSTLAKLMMGVAKPSRGKFFQRPRHYRAGYPRAGAARHRLCLSAAGAV